MSLRRVWKQRLDRESVGKRSVSLQSKTFGHDSGREQSVCGCEADAEQSASADVDILQLALYSLLLLA